MNQYKEEYDKRKNNVLQLLDDSIKYFSEYDSENKETIDALISLKDSTKKGVFSIVLVGEFSAGKSTFLNALMHKRILPSFTSETTATVNFLRHISEAPNGEAGIVYYSDGRTKVLPNLELTTIEKVVSTRGDKGDDRIATSVDHVDLFLDSKFLENGVMLVDSPGLNGVADNHREITEAQIKKSHASIFMFSADHPGSKTDFDYLRELKSQSRNIFFVLNKINVIKKSEGQRVEDIIKELKESYHKQFPDETELPKIWPVAGNAALVARDLKYNEYQNGEIVTTEERRNQLEKESRMEAFEDRLWRYLTEGERAKADLSEPITKAIKWLNDAEDNIKSQLDVLNNEQSSESLLQQKEALEEERKNLKKEHNEGMKPLRERFNRALADIRNSMDAKCKEIENTINADIESIEDVGELQDYSQSLVSKLDTKYSKLFRDLDEELQTELSLVIQEEQSDYLSEWQSSVSENLGENILKIKPDKWELNEVVISNNLEKFDEEEKEMRKQIKAKQAEIDKIGSEKISAQIIEDDIESKKKELQQLREQRNTFINNFKIPDVVYRRETEDYDRGRGGIFGGLAYIFVGSNIQTREVTKVDTTARDEAKAERDKQLAIMDKEIESIDKELSQTGKSRTNSTALDFELKRAERALHELNEEYNAKHNQLIEQIKDNKSKAIRRMKRNIENYVEDRSETLSGWVKSSLDKQKSNYYLVIEGLLKTSIENEFDKLEKKLTDLEKLIQASDKERDKKMTIAQNAENELTALKNRAFEISTDIDASMTDEIEQEAL